MNILFIAVFSPQSTNNSQRDCLIELGHNVEEFNYRSIPNYNFELQKKEGYDIILIAKGSGINSYTMDALSKNNNKVIYWFPDPSSTFSPEFSMKVELSDVAYFDKIKALNMGKKVNSNCYYVCEGYDSKIDSIQDIPKEYDVSFIGNLYGSRAEVLKQIPNIQIISTAYGSLHSIEVGKTKININLCTDNCASDRIYKILAAGGFLLTDDWEGREFTGLKDGKDLIIFNSVNDLKEKIEYYLKNEQQRINIANRGYITNKKLNRLEWAKSITYPN
tara:strand:+ start:265 stop:1092 length:828 start_codon:yes stop_codon:yes gene_type:complete